MKFKKKINEMSIKEQYYYIAFFDYIRNHINSILKLKIFHMKIKFFHYSKIFHIDTVEFVR